MALARSSFLHTLSANCKVQQMTGKLYYKLSLNILNFRVWHYRQGP